jgi:cell division protein FtsW
VTAIAPSIALRRRGRDSAARPRAALARPPAFVVVCATVAVLNVVGLVMILSASSVAALSNYGSSWYFFNRQVAWALVGATAFAVSARVDYRFWRRASPWLLLGAGALLVAVLLPGVGIRVDGSRRWLGAGALRVQPSELAKVAIVVFGAHLCSRPAAKLVDWRVWRPLAVATGVLGLLVVLEPDLDSTVVLGIIAFSILVVAGVRARHLTWLGGSAVALAAVLAVAEPYRRARVLTFLDPWSDTSNTGYQISQSLIALGSGGLDGVGLGAGRAKWLFLRNAHTDFIFAIIGEELGLLGCFLVLGLFAGFALVGLHIARGAPDRFGMLLATGVTAWVAGQAAINLGAVVGVLPVSGITLPFLSAGGSSLCFTMTAAGMLANVARQSVPATRRSVREPGAPPRGRRER